MKIFVTADNHLGKNLKKRKALRDYALDNFRQIPDKITSDVEYVIFAGDIFDKDNTDIECCSVYMNVLRRIINMKNIINVLIISGNHDSYNEYYNNAAIDIANSLDSPKIVTVANKYKTFIDPVHKIFMSLIPWSKKLFLLNEGERTNFEEYISNIEFENKNEYDDYFKIMVSHFPIIDWMPFASHGVTMDMLQKQDFYDLMILGDLHNEKLEKLDDKVDVIYTGSTMQTSIEDLRTHKNCAKILEIDDGVLSSITPVEFDKPDIAVMNSGNYDESRINEKTIIITDDLNFHMKVKDLCLYSLYKPSANNSTDNSGAMNVESFEELDMNQIAKDKIDSDETLNDKTRIFLKALLDIDTESLSSDDIQKHIEDLMSDNS